MYINEFKGEYRFLSNFYESKLIINNKEFNSVEHYYQASKATNIDDFERIRLAKTPVEAKK